MDAIYFTGTQPARHAHQSQIGPLEQDRFSAPALAKLLNLLDNQYTFVFLLSFYMFPYSDLYTVLEIKPCGLVSRIPDVCS